MKITQKHIALCDIMHYSYLNYFGYRDYLGAQKMICDFDKETIE